MNAIKATITGSGQFPLDMLRYDSCWPSSSEDVNKIHDSFSDHHEWSISVTRRPLEKRKDKQYWTVDRWHSFGVRIFPQL
jgi:hypothetical protein